LVEAHGLPPQTRVSLGSAIVLRLSTGKLDAAPTTAYLMTYTRNRCMANCGFCPQARLSQSKADMLSRVSWPAFPTGQVLGSMRKAVEDGRIRRVCIQALNYRGVLAHLAALVKAIGREMKVPISVSCQPLGLEDIELLSRAGAERIGIALDAATSEVFDRVKGGSAGGPYLWERQLQVLRDALTVFGEGRVSTHLIVGLGETEREMADIIQQCMDWKVLPALFAFTPIAGTALSIRSQPSVGRYRRMQVARYLIVHEIVRFENMSFDKSDRLVSFGVDDQTLLDVIRNGEPFRTSGCPNCNRPYYNEKPSGPVYNYPRNLSKDQISDAERTLKLRD
jgi:biotin synthase